MRPEVIMVLGKCVWRRGSGGWCRESPQDLGASLAVHVHDLVSRTQARRMVLVYEPAGMGHQEVECPKASRVVFSSISRIKTEFPVVVSEDLGWGMEPPVPVAGGSYSTLLHYELGRGLAHACSPSARGPEVIAAWSVFSLAESCIIGRLPGEGSVLFLLPGFVAFVAGSRGRRSFRVWPQPMSEREWQTLAFMVVGEGDQAGSDDRKGAGAIAVVAQEDPAGFCPLWEDIRNSGRLECIVSLDEFAACASKMSPRHPGNLVLGFPTPVCLDPLLTGIAIAAVVVAALTCASLRADATEFTREDDMSRAHTVELRYKADSLEKNRSELDLLQSELPESSGAIPSAAAAALHGLAAAIPDSLTLARFSLSGGDSFEIEATLVGREFDQEAVKRALGRNGFSTGTPGSWTYDAAARRLSASGKFEPPAK